MNKAWGVLEIDAELTKSLDLFAQKYYQGMSFFALHDVDKEAILRAYKRWVSFKLKTGVPK
jgi:hypothetical protein